MEGIQLDKKIKKYLGIFEAHLIKQKEKRKKDWKKHGLTEYKQFLYKSI